MSLAAGGVLLLLGLHAFPFRFRFRGHAASRAGVAGHSGLRSGTSRRIVIRSKADVHGDEQRLRVVSRVELLRAGCDRTTGLRAVPAVDVRHTASLIAQLLLKGKELDPGESSLSGSQGWASH